MSELQAVWDATVEACLNGHDTCSYGGMTPGTGYWLADEACERKHGGECSWCDAEAVTGFAGWAPDGVSIYGVPACQPCADRWVAGHPEWERREPQMGGPSLDTLRAEVEAEREQVLAAMSPVERELWLAAERATENLMLWGDPDGGAPGAKMSFAGIESIFGLDQAVSMIPCYSDRKPLGPARQRYNPVTKKWEADRD